MRHIARCLILAAPLLATAAEAQRAGTPAQAQAQAQAQAPAAPAPASPAGPPHEWLFGSWTGGLYPPGDTDSARCFGQPTVIFTRDAVLRAGILDPAYRQRFIETVATRPGGATFRFIPAGAPNSRLAAEMGFGCPGGPDTLEVEVTSPNEITFPNCREMPSPLRRCGTPSP